jgi:hypothetical protein
MNERFTGPFGPVATPPASTEPAPAPPPPSTSPAQARFDSCRWARTEDGDSPAHCSHGNVFPFAGKSGFRPDSWCADCAYYKTKRKPPIR